MISQKNQEMISTLRGLMPRRPRTERSIERKTALDEAIRLLARDVDQEKVEEYKQGYKDGKKDAFLAQQNLKVRTHPECIS